MSFICKHVCILRDQSYDRRRYTTQRQISDMINGGSIIVYVLLTLKYYVYIIRTEHLDYE